MRFRAVALAACLTATPLHAQRTPSAVPLQYQATPGSAWERYVRALDLAGWVAPLNMGIRGWSQDQLRRGAAGSVDAPWDGAYTVAADRSVDLGWLPARIAVTHNSDFPFQQGGGPVWYGRGATTELRFGGFWRAGPLSVVLSPVWYRSENRDFRLAPTAHEGDGQFRRDLDPWGLDLPQRFGDEAYGRLDLGNSSVTLAGAGLVLGLSAAPQQWGPGDAHPLVLGAGGGGVPHVFLGTSRPLDAWFARLHLRYMAGQTVRSAVQAAPEGERRAFLNGFVFVAEPRGLPGLEVGVTRLFHSQWPQDARLSSLLALPFEGLLKQNLDGTDQRVDDQYASAFVRWAHRSSGFEVFGEFVRTDHSWDLRTLALEPEDFGGYAVGLRRVWKGREGRLSTLRAEVTASGATHRERGGARLHLARRAGPIYLGPAQIGGLTHRGQFLATVAGPYGNGQTLGFDRYGSKGRWSVDLDRRVVRDRTIGVVTDAQQGDVDVLHVLGGEWVRFAGNWDIEVGASGIYEVDRHLLEDAFNFRLRVGLGRRLR